MLYYTSNPNGLKKDFTKNVKVIPTTKTLSWIAKNAKHVYVDRNWQRNFVWNTLKQMLFTTNVFNGHSTSQNMLLANVKDCLAYCEKNKVSSRYTFWDDFWLGIFTNMHHFSSCISLLIDVCYCNWIKRTYWIVSF